MLFLDLGIVISFCSAIEESENSFYSFCIIIVVEILPLENSGWYIISNLSNHLHSLLVNSHN